MLTIGEIETLLECISSFGEYFDDYEVLDSATRKLKSMRSKIISSKKDDIIDEEKENKYNYARKIIYDLKVCYAINHEVYIHWLNKIDEDEKLNI